MQFIVAVAQYSTADENGNYFICFLYEGYLYNWDTGFFLVGNNSTYATCTGNGITGTLIMLKDSNSKTCDCRSLNSLLAQQ